jgi:hypothetical protein
MKKYIKTFCLAVVLLVEINCFAQQTEYKNYLVEKERKDYNQSQIDKARNNTNSKSNSYSVDMEAAKKMVDSWKVKSAPVDLAEIQKREERLKKIRTKDSLEFEDKIQRSIAYEKRIKPYIDEFISAGLTKSEGEDLVKYKLNNESIDLSNVTESIINTLYFLSDNVDNLTINEFEIQIAVLSPYAPITSLKLLDVMKARFPNEKEIINNITLNCLISYYSSNLPTAWGEEETIFQMFKRFEDLIKIYPQAELIIYEFKGRLDTGPYQSIVFKTDKKTDKKKYYKMYGNESKMDNQLALKYNNLSQSAEDLIRYLEYNKTKKLNDIITISRVWDKKSASRDYKGNYERIYIYIPDFRCSDEVLLELSEMGNFDAQVNLVAKNCVNNSNIELKDKLYAMFLKRAVENDDLEAYKMLFNIPLWESLYVSEIVNKKLNDIPYSSEPNSPYNKVDYTERNYNLDLQMERIDRAYAVVKKNICNIKKINQLDYHINNFKIFGTLGRHKVIVPFHFTYPSADEKRDLSEYWVKNCLKK